MGTRAREQFFVKFLTCECFGANEQLQRDAIRRMHSITGIATQIRNIHESPCVLFLLLLLLLLPPPPPPPPPSSSSSSASSSSSSSSSSLPMRIPQRMLFLTINSSVSSFFRSLCSPCSFLHSSHLAFVHLYFRPVVVEYFKIKTFQYLKGAFSSECFFICHGTI